MTSAIKLVVDELGGFFTESVDLIVVLFSQFLQLYVEKVVVLLFPLSLVVLFVLWKILYKPFLQHVPWQIVRLD